MNCSDYEMDLYLYAELSDEERRELNRHLETCASCRELFQTVEKSQAMIRAVASQEPAPRHAARLTRKIMDGIAAGEKPKSVVEIFLDWVATGAVRYSLITTTVALVLWFGSEMATSVSTVQEPSTGTVVINARELRKSFVRRKPNKPAYAGCISPLRNAANWKDCIKSNLN